jgi:hypothetical protein
VGWWLSPVSTICHMGSVTKTVLPSFLPSFLCITHDFLFILPPFLFILSLLNPPSFPPSTPLSSEDAVGFVAGQHLLTRHLRREYLRHRRRKYLFSCCFCPVVNIQSHKVQKRIATLGNHFLCSLSLRDRSRLRNGCVLAIDRPLKCHQAVGSEMVDHVQTCIRCAVLGVWCLVCGCVGRISGKSRL